MSAHLQGDAAAAARRLTVDCNLKYELQSRAHIEFRVEAVNELNRVGTGRDAKHVAFATFFGDVRTGELLVWAQAFVAGDGPIYSREALVRMTGFIRDTMLYLPRISEGVAEPVRNAPLRQRHLSRFRHVDD